MKTVKKAAAILCVVCLLFSCMCVPAVWTAESATNFSDDAQMLVALGIYDTMPDDTMLRAGVTRGRAAQLVARIMGVDVSGTSTVIFTDVPADHMYAASIAAVVNMGVMNGLGDGTFAPDESISYQDFLKILVNVLGYGYRAEYQGGYPMGYIQQANQLGLIGGIVASYEQQVNLGAVSHMLYAALEVDMMDIVGYGDNLQAQVVEGKNLLNTRLDIDFGFGRVTQTPASGIAVNQKCPDGYVEIDNRRFADQTQEAAELLGLTVKYYYRMSDGSTDDTLIYIQPRQGYNETLCLDSDNIIGFENNSYTYVENNRTKLQKIAADCDVLYNGVFSSALQDMHFVPADGSVELIDTQNSGSYDLVRIWDVQLMVVQSYSQMEETVYDKYNPALQLDLHSDANRQVEVVDTAGNAVKPGNLREYDVLSVIHDLDDTYVKAVLSRNTVSGMITEYSGMSSADTLTIGGTAYPLHITFVEHGCENMTLNREVDVHLDAEGRVAAISLGSGENQYGFLAAVGQEKGLDQPLEFLIFTKDEQMLRAQSADTVTIDGVRLKESEDMLARLSPSGTFVSGLVLYKLNTEGRVTYIDTPYFDTEHELEGTLRKSFAGYDENKQGVTQLTYKSTSKILGGKVAVKDDAVIFVAPPTSGETDEELYTIRQLSYFGNDGSYFVDAYTVEPEFGPADVLVMYQSVVEKIDKNSQVGMVDYVTQTLDTETGEVREKVYLYSNGEQELMVDGADVLPQGLAQGDILYFNLNNRGMIASAQLVYRRAEDQMVMGNPTASLYEGATLRSMLGYVYSKVDNYVAVSLKDPVAYPELTLDDVEIHRLDNFQVYVYDSQAPFHKVSTAGGADLIGYVQSPNDYVKVLVCTRLGDPRTIFIYR